MKRCYSLLLVFIILFSCKKSNNTNQLPVLGHTGENILACNVNGSPFIISGYMTAPALLSSVNGVEYSYLVSNTPSFFIYGVQKNTNIKIWFYFNYNGTPSIYNFYFDTTLVNPFIQYGGGYSGYETTSTNPGTVDITYFDGKIVAGTFSFDAFDSSAVVHITNGEFDININ